MQARRAPFSAYVARLQRVVLERVVSAAGIVEDGSAAQWKSDFRWKDADGNELPLRSTSATDTPVAPGGRGTASGASVTW